MKQSQDKKYSKFKNYKHGQNKQRIDLQIDFNSVLQSKTNFGKEEYCHRREKNLPRVMLT